MELLKLFKREASTFAAEPIDASMIPDHKDCNCFDVLLGPEGQEVKSSMERGGIQERRKGHRKVMKAILGLMSRGENGDNDAINLLGQMKRTTPVTGNPGQEVERHILSHVDGAGLTHRDFGIEDRELGQDYIRGRETAMGAMNDIVGNPADYRPTENYPESHCGTCQQYLTSLKGQAHKFYSEMTNKNQSIPEADREFANLGVRGIFSRMMDSWTRKKPVVLPVAPEHFEEGNKILSAWNKHSERDHGTGLDPYAYLKNTPVISDETATRFDNLYRGFEGLTPGWESTRRPDVPPKQMGGEIRQKLETEFPFEELADRYVREPVTPQERQKAEGIASQMKEQGLLEDYVLPNTTDNTSLPQRIVESPNVTGFGKGHNYTLERKTVDNQLTYNPDRWNADYEGTLTRPRYNWMSLPKEYDTDRPEIIAQWENHLQLGPGPINCVHESHGDDDDARGTCDGWHKQDISDLMHINREDAYLFQKAGMMPDLGAHKEYVKAQRAYEVQPTHDNEGNRIPEENRVAAPDEGMRTRGLVNYNASYAKALEKAYPGMPRDQALDALYDEHQGVVKKLESARGEKFRTSSKENNMPQFNSRYEKEAHVDHSLLQQGFDAITHAVQHGGDWAIQRGQQLVKDMVNPISDKFDGKRKVLEQLQDHVKLEQEMNYPYGESLADTQLQDYIVNNTGSHINLTGLGADAAATVGLVKNREKIKNWARGQFGIGGKHTASFSERYAADSSKLPCTKCGKKCKDEVECKSNQDDRRRQQAADNAFND